MTPTTSATQTTNNLLRRIPVLLLMWLAQHTRFDLLRRLDGRRSYVPITPAEQIQILLLFHGAEEPSMAHGGPVATRSAIPMALTNSPSTWISLITICKICCNSVPPILTVSFLPDPNGLGIPIRCYVRVTNLPKRCRDLWRRLGRGHPQINHRSVGDRDGGPAVSSRGLVDDGADTTKEERLQSSPFCDPPLAESSRNRATPIGLGEGVGIL
jgi:hypothetical protein